MSWLLYLVPLLILFELWQLYMGHRYLGVKQISTDSDPRTLGLGEATAFVEEWKGKHYGNVRVVGTITPEHPVEIQQRQPVQPRADADGQPLEPDLERQDHDPDQSHIFVYQTENADKTLIQ